MDPRGLQIADFTYDLPDARIAQFAVEPRDAAKLLVYAQGAAPEARTGSGHRIRSGGRGFFERGTPGIERNPRRSGPTVLSSGRGPAV